MNWCFPVSTSIDPLHQFVHTLIDLWDQWFEVAMGLEGHFVHTLIDLWDQWFEVAMGLEGQFVHTLIDLWDEWFEVAMGLKKTIILITTVRLSL